MLSRKGILLLPLPTTTPLLMIQRGCNNWLEFALFFFLRLSCAGFWVYDTKSDLRWFEIYRHWMLFTQMYVWKTFYSLKNDIINPINCWRLPIENQRVLNASDFYENWLKFSKNRVEIFSHHLTATTSRKDQGTLTIHSNENMIFNLIQL